LQQIRTQLQQNEQKPNKVNAISKRHCAGSIYTRLTPQAASFAHLWPLSYGFCPVYTVKKKCF